MELDRNGDIPCHLLILGKPDVDIPDHPRIHCPGFLHHSELPAWYRTGDVFVFLSWLDNCPNTVMEAVSCGLPVICTNQGGTREIVQKTSGGIIVEADAPYFSAEVDLYHPPEPDYNKIIEAILNVFEDYDEFCNSIHIGEIDIRHIAVKYIEFIRQSLNGHR